MSHPNEEPAYEEIFADYFARLREDYYRQQRQAVGRGIQLMLDRLASDEGGSSFGESAELDAGERDRAMAALDRLVGDSGKHRGGKHTAQSLKETLVALAKHRY